VQHVIMKRLAAVMHGLLGLSICSVV